MAAVFLAGLIQLLLGFLRAGSIANYFPSNVIKGMLTAIGIIIILKQIPHAIGYDADTEGNLSFSQSDGKNTFSAFSNLLPGIHVGVTVITILSLVLMTIWEKPFMNRIRIVPGALAAVILSIFLNYLFIEFFPAIAVGKEHPPGCRSK